MLLNELFLIVNFVILPNYCMRKNCYICYFNAWCKSSYVEGGRVGASERVSEGAREGGREGGREEGRKGGREEGRKGGRVGIGAYGIFIPHCCPQH